ncbi:MAG: hypothetical protein ACOC5K_04415 [Chloroflexota bacterium]
MSSGQDRIRNIGQRLGGDRQKDPQEQDALVRARRAELFDEARDRMHQIRPAVIDRVAELTTSAEVDDRRTSVRLSDAVIQIPEERQAEPRGLAYDQSRAPFDVIAYTEVAVLTPPADRTGYRGRSHSLWFCDARTEGEYHWYETAFMVAPGFRNTRPVYPFALPPGEDAGKALSVVFDRYEVAWPFTVVESHALEGFSERWLNYLADAAEGMLRAPVNMPEHNPKGTWRRA